MTAKQRIKQLEKQAAQNNTDSPLTWKEFIEWCNGNLKFDAAKEARLHKEWTEFIAKTGGDE